MATINEEIIAVIVKSAAKQYHGGMELQSAVRVALRERGITDPATYREFYGKVCSILGKRGGVKRAELKRKSGLAVRNGKRRPEQASLQFTR